MPTKTLFTPMDGTPKQICFANHAGDFNPTSANDLRKTTDGTQETDCELVLLNLTDGLAAQSAKVDLGSNWASVSVRACIEMQVAAATDGEVIEFYWSPSQNSAPATGNAGGCSGSAAAYSGYSSDLATSVKQLIHIGNMIMTDDAFDSIQVGFVGVFTPPHQYGCLVVKNEAGQTVCDTDDIEAHVVFDPIVDETQDV